MIAPVDDQSRFSLPARSSIIKEKNIGSHILLVSVAVWGFSQADQSSTIRQPLVSCCFEGLRSEEEPLEKSLPFLDDRSNGRFLPQK